MRNENNRSIIFNKCLECGKELTERRFQGGLQKKYCDSTCRNKYYYKKYHKPRRQREKYQEKLAMDGREKVQCEICGNFYIQLGTHVYQVHRMTAREYKKEFGLDLKKGIIPAGYRELKSFQVFAGGGIKNLEKGKKTRFKKGQKGLGIYPRSLQTLERLKTLYLYRDAKRNKLQNRI